GMTWIARTLFPLNILFFVVLVALTAVRLVVYRDKFWADVTDHKRGVGFFTSVAASCVLGTQFLLLGQSRSAATVLWVVGIVLWLVLTYTIFTSLTIKPAKPTLAEGLHGGWLVSVVAAQAVSQLSSLLAGG